MKGGRVKGKNGQRKKKDVHANRYERKGALYVACSFYGVGASRGAKTKVKILEAVVKKIKAKGGEIFRTYSNETLLLPVNRLSNQRRLDKSLRVLALNLVRRKKLG